ncbi:MAG: hypothetical protein IT455_11230 [Planctomycetes bacterium]|nr:hypothetical protein [Planctomycetota bacterium]
MPSLRPLLLFLFCCVGAVTAQGDAPWRTKLRTLATTPGPATKPEKADLLREELAFVPKRRWLLFPELAKELATDEVPAATVLQVLDEGGKAMRQALAAEQADKDVGAASALFVVTLWQCATGRELSEAQSDAVHAQVVQVLACPEIAAMSDADKQRCWEYCVGYVTWFAAMFELANEEEQQQALQKAAATVFAELCGAAPDALQPGGRGLVGKPGRTKPKPPATTPVETPAAETTPTTPTTPPTTAPAETPSLAPPMALPASGPAIEGVTWTAPAGWSEEKNGGTVIYRGTLRDVENDGTPSPRSEAAHQAAIGFLPVMAATSGPSALFERLWREQFAAFEPGDTFMHFRGRLPSQLVVLYMGRFHRKPNTPQTMGNPDTYGALWLVDLGGNRFQPIVAVVEPRDPGIGMDSFKESEALRAFCFPLGKVLDSVAPKSGKPPYPAGGYFAASDLLGDWEQSSSGYGGTYYNTNTGGFAGVAVTASSGTFSLRGDGTYDYSFGYYATNPQLGNSSGSTKHGGSYRLDGDVVLVTPSQPIGYEFTCCAVGVGRVVGPQGERRVLVTVSKHHQSGSFLQMPLIPNGTNCDSTLSFFVEKAK